MKRVILSLLSIVLLLSLVSAASYENNYTLPAEGVNNAYFVVQTLKYEPYPVTQGDWFDLWVKVQNIGEEDAKNAEFTLQPEYPFISNDSLVRDYGIVPGKINAHNFEQAGESGIEGNQVLLKFRVQVADNAPEGTAILKIKATPDKYSGTSTVYNLPIEISKTKTSFDFVLQQSNNYASTFTITNIGEASANGIIVKLNEDEWTFSNSQHSVNLAKLGANDFTSITVYGNPKPGITQAHLTVSYTDESGVRRESTYTVPVSSNSTVSGNTSERPYTKWIFGLIGILVGVLLMIISRSVHRSKRSTH